MFLAGSMAAVTSLATASARGAAKRKCTIGYQPYCMPYIQANIIRMSGVINRFMPSDVEVEWSRTLAGVVIINDMIAGRTNIGLMGDSPAAIGSDKGVGIVLGATSYDNGELGALVVRSNLKIKTVRELEGARIGVPFGSFSHRQLLTMLKTYSIKAELLNLDIRLQVSRLKNNTLEACCTWEPYPSYIENLGIGRRLMTGIDVDRCSCMSYVDVPKHNLSVIGVVMGTESIVKNNRDIAVGYMMAMEYANAMIIEKPDLAAYYAWLDVQDIPQSIIRVGMDMCIPDTTLSVAVKAHLSGVGKMWEENKLVGKNFQFNYSDVAEEARKKLVNRKYVSPGFPGLLNEHQRKLHSWENYKSISLSKTDWKF
jgi:NitT/TauT family transport system substrate-binding protein